MDKQDNSKFAIGDVVSYNVGSDVYTGNVSRVTPARVFVLTANQGEIMFTKRTIDCSRPYVRYVYKGRDHGTLQHGGEAYSDPSF